MNTTTPTDNLVKYAGKLKLICILSAVITLFITACKIENNQMTVLDFTYTTLLVVSVFILINELDNFSRNRRFNRVREYFNLGESQVNVISLAESHLSTDWTKEDNQEDLGNIKGLVRGYNFEYEYNGKFRYTNTKLIKDENSLYDALNYIDESNEVYGYYPTGRAVFRGYWVLRNGKYKRVRSRDFLVSNDNRAILRGSKIDVVDKNNRKYDEGVVVKVFNHKVIYSPNDNPERRIQVDYENIIVTE